MTTPQRALLEALVTGLAVWGAGGGRASGPDGQREPAVWGAWDVLAAPEVQPPPEKRRHGAVDTSERHSRG